MVFHSYLSELIQRKEDAFSINLKTAIPAMPNRVIKSTDEQTGDRTVQNLEMRVLSPLFYSRLVHYVSVSEAIDRECIFTDEKHRTLWISSPQLLPLLLANRKALQAKAKGSSANDRSYLSGLRWKLLKKLRCPLASPTHCVTPVSSFHNVSDIRPRPYSELDGFMRKRKNQAEAGEYRRIVTKLFLAERFCFGYSEIVDLADVLLRVLLCYLGVMQLMICSRKGLYVGFAVGKPAVATQVGGAVYSGLISWDWRSFSSGAFWVLACHAYELLKGYS